MKKVMILITVFVLNLFTVNAQNVSNPNNPFDMIGKGHNEALEYVQKSIGFDFKGDFTKSIAGYLSQQFTQKEVNAYLTKKKDKEDKKLSTFETKVLKQIFSAIENEKDINSITKKIIDIEKQILVNKPQIPVESFKMLMSAASVARFSNFYWNNFEVKGNEKKAKPKWIKIIFADIKGAINSEGGTCDRIGEAAKSSCEAASKSKN